MYRVAADNNGYTPQQVVMIPNKRYKNSLWQAVKCWLANIEVKTDYYTKNKEGVITYHIEVKGTNAYAHWYVTQNDMLNLLNALIEFKENKKSPPRFIYQFDINKPQHVGISDYIVAPMIWSIVGQFNTTNNM